MQVLHYNIPSEGEVVTPSPPQPEMEHFLSPTCSDLYSLPPASLFQFATFDKFHYVIFVSFWQRKINYNSRKLTLL